MIAGASALIFFKRFVSRLAGTAELGVTAPSRSITNLLKFLCQTISFNSIHVRVCIDVDKHAHDKHAHV